MSTEARDTLAAANIALQAAEAAAMAEIADALTKSGFVVERVASVTIAGQVTFDIKVTMFTREEGLYFASHRPRTTPCRS